MRPAARTTHMMITCQSADIDPEAPLAVLLGDLVNKGKVNGPTAEVMVEWKCSEHVTLGLPAGLELRGMWAGREWQHIQGPVALETDTRRAGIHVGTQKGA
eukprot:jgi/Tetstr1/441526/TSEL_029756.t1